MNIESKSLNKSTALVDKCQQSSTPCSSSACQNMEGKSFKDELETVVTVEPEVALTQAVVENNPDALKNSDNKVLSQQKNISKSAGTDKANKLGLSELEESNLLGSLNELGQKIATVQDLKKDSLKTNKSDSSVDELKSSLDYSVIKMDNNDALFFVNLVNGQNLKGEMSNDFSSSGFEIKSDAFEGASRVSAALTDALSESMKTNKPFRVDFGNDIAVILKVDKEGKISAEFIPGDKAVEQYLKNNIPLLKERFDSQNLSYSDLSYQKHKQNRQQNESNNKNNKENDDE